MGDKQGDEAEQLKDIEKPHAHDVLSGRGNFVNHHSGNENFRSLVKRHKKAYVACPKAQKANFSKLIYDEIRSMKPPGRFLKQDPNTKLWSDIGEKKALDKTRQALREGAPELLKELEAELGEGENDGDFNGDFVAPLRHQQQRPNNLSESLSYTVGNASLGSFSLGSVDLTNVSGSFTSNGPMPNQVGRNNDYDRFFASHGTNAILAAAAQLQGAQSGQNMPFTESQLQLLKSMQISHHNNMNSFGGGIGGGNNESNIGGGNFAMGNNRDFSDYSALLAAAQANNNFRLANEEYNTLLSAAQCNPINAMGGGSGRDGVGNEASLRQLAQQMAAREFQNFSGGNNFCNLVGNHNVGSGTINDISNNNGINNHYGLQSDFPINRAHQEDTVTLNVPLKSLDAQQPRNEDTIITTTVPLKGGSDGPVKALSRGHGQTSPNNHETTSLDSNSNSVRAARGGVLSGSLTRRGGLTGTTRRSNRHLQTDVTSSLMSIESLTLDDIQSTAGESGQAVTKKVDSLANMSLSLAEFNESGMSNVFEDVSVEVGAKAGQQGSEKKKQLRIHGKGPYDVSELSDVNFDEIK